MRAGRILAAHSGQTAFLSRNATMSHNGTILYTGKTFTTGDRERQSRSSDNRLDIELSPPGSAGMGTNPEQLLAAGWSACFIGAMGSAARE